MRWAECSAFVSALLLAGSVHADAPAYGKVETFQPGKKYNCVPTADRKAWDCSESGKAAQQQTHDDTPVAQPSPSNPPPAEPALKASALPSYLTNSAAGSNRTNSPVPAASANPPIAPESRVEKNPSPAPEMQPFEPAPPQAASVSAPPSQSPPAARSTPASTAAEKSPVPPPTKSTAAAQAVAKPASAARRQTQMPRSDDEFASLSGEQYVLELAHADGADLNVPVVPRGKVYKLHLRQNGAERWLLLWGPFESVESARAARDEIAAQGTTPGWPRRVAPLQAEARRNSE